MSSKFKNYSKERIDLIIKNGLDEWHYFTNSVYTDVLIFLMDLKKNDSNLEINNLLQFTIINRILILQQNCINIFTNDSMKNKKEYSKENIDLTMNLNSFYFHLSGLIDNLGWYIEYKYQILDLNLKVEKDRKQVGLSKKRNKNFYRELKLKNNEVYLIIQQYQKWIDDLHEKRDPITHRMPLYIPPTVMTYNKPEFMPVYSLNSETLNEFIPEIINNSFTLYKLIIDLIEIKDNN